MSIVSRREFIATSAATAGMMALRPQGVLAQQPSTDMTIARWGGQKPNDEELKDIAVKLTTQAIEGLGGMNRFVKRGDVVWIKPNIGWDRKPEQAANTNPELVATLLQMCFNAGAKTIKIGDNPCNPAIKTYENSGIAPIARKLGAKVLFLDESRYKEMAVKGELIKTHPVYPEIVECDLVINVPVLKHHRLADLTMCMKNYMGVIGERKSFHNKGFATCVADITRFMKPRLCILDAIRVLTANGPSGGKLEDVAVKGTVAAGVDIVALDAFGAEVMGKDPKAIESVKKGEETGLGKIDYRSLALKEFSVT